MQENLSLTVPMTANGAAILMSVAATLTGGSSTAEPPKGKPGRKSNAEKAAAAAAAAGQPAPVQAGATAQGPADDGLGLDDAGGDELGLDDTPPPAAPTVKYTLEGTDPNTAVIAAFKKRIETDKGDKAKASAALASFGVKSVRDLKEDQYGAVIAKLK